jgi:hypothetical protein
MGTRTASFWIGEDVYRGVGTPAICVVGQQPRDPRPSGIGVGIVPAFNSPSLTTLFTIWRRG